MLYSTGSHLARAGVYVKDAFTGSRSTRPLAVRQPVSSAWMCWLCAAKTVGSSGCPAGHDSYVITVAMQEPCTNQRAVPQKAAHKGFLSSRPLGIYLLITSAFWCCLCTNARAADSYGAPAGTGLSKGGPPAQLLLLHVSIAASPCTIDLLYSIAYISFVGSTISPWRDG